MATELDILAQDDPIEASMLKGYEQLELDMMIGYMDQTITWLQSNGLYVDNESIVAIRVGVPYLGSDETVDAETLYTNDGTIEQLIASLGLDFIKITAKSTDITLSDNNRLLSYTYKSPYIHRIFSNYYYDGIHNTTGLAYLDTLDVLPSKLATPLVKYNGIEQIVPIIPMDVPLYITSCMQYIVQNPKLVMAIVNLDDNTVGDTMYLTGQKFFETIVSAKYNAETKFPTITEEELPASREEAIREILEYIGMDEAFKSLDYGGLIESMRIVLRVPASRANQDQMERLLTKDDIFRDIFVEEWIHHSDKDVSESQKEEDLNDPYSTEVGTDFTVGGVSILDDVYDGNYGCKGGGEEVVDENGILPGEDGYIPTYSPIIYRYWRISDAWLHTLTAENIAIVFWAGLDLVSTMDNNPCPFDTILIIIVIIVITYFTAGLGSVGASGLSAAQGLAIASAIVSIGTVIGAIDPTTGKILGAVLAVASLGTTALTTELLKMAPLEAVQFATHIASTALTVVDTIETVSYEKEMEELESNIEELGENAEFYESEIRYMLGGYQDRHISEGCGFDYERVMNNQFNKYSIYDGPGFRKS